MYIGLLGTPFWGTMGLPWIPVGRHWAPFGRPWSSFWPPLGCLGVPLGSLGLPLGGLGVPCGCFPEILETGDLETTSFCENVRFAYTKPLLFRVSNLNGGHEGFEG